MTSCSSKTAAFTVMFALGLFLSTAAHANIVRTDAGVPVLTSDDTCVITDWEGEDDCEAAKLEAGLGGVESKPVAEEAVRPSRALREGVVYFGFNKSTLTPKAKAYLDHMAKKLVTISQKKHRVSPSMTIVGYADRVGNAEYNEKLAMTRAKAVSAYLISKGVDAKKIETRSLGKTAPKADCSADLPRAKLIDCLAEDRRVEIEFSR